MAHRALALFYLDQKRAPEAEPHFKALASQSTDGQLALADYYTGLRRFDEAQSILQAISTPEAASRQARIRMAAVQQMKGERQAALATATRLVESAPDDVDARLLRARLLLADPARRDAAWADAQAAAKADPSSPAAQYTLGLVALARHDAQAAEEAFDRAVALNPRAGSAAIELARLRLARGDASAALTAAEAAVRARDGDAESAIVLARALRARAGSSIAPAASCGHDSRHRRTPLASVWSSDGRNSGAAGARGAYSDFERALAVAPADAEARAGAIAARSRRPRCPASAGPGVTMARGIRRRSVDADSRRAGGSCRAGYGRRGTAPQRGAARAPDRLDAYELLGGLYVSQGNDAAALDRYRALAARSPDATAPATVVGMLLERTDRQAARSQYEAVLAKDPRAAVAANNLAWMLAEDGRFAEAMRWGRVAVDEMRNRPESHDTLGWIYLKNNQSVEAIAEFSKAVDMAPRNTLYRDHLQQAKTALTASR